MRGFGIYLVQKFGDQLAEYFLSGWAFLVPYQAAYLLFYVFDLPVHPGASLVPSLLHVYWLIHGIHAMLLAGLAIRWLRSKALAKGATSAIPWAALFLVLWIPGTYLEWPADSWEHLRRVYEWSNHDSIRLHSSSHKAGYFLTYSVARPWPGAIEIFPAALGLLLAWQYFRLCRALQISQPFAFVATVIHILALGTGAFSFYRYYALATTIVAHLATLAFLRIVIEAVSPLHAGPRPPLRRRILAVMNLLLLIAFSHLQALAISALGAVACAGWHLAQTRPRVFAGIGLLCSGTAAVAWALTARSTELAERLIGTGWLTSWGSFNVLSWGSPAAVRALEFLGVIGVCDFFLGALLLFRNQLAGWITVAPVLVLLLPGACVPLLAVLPPESPELVAAFGRVLFAVPTGLAMAAALRLLPARVRVNPITPTVAVGGALLAFLGLSPGDGGYNRAWHALTRYPTELHLSSTQIALSSLPAEPFLSVSSRGQGFILNCIAPSYFPFVERPLHEPRDRTFETTLRMLRALDPRFDYATDRSVETTWVRALAPTVDERHRDMVGGQN